MTAPICLIDQLEIASDPQDVIVADGCTEGKIPS